MQIPWKPRKHCFSFSDLASYCFDCNEGPQPWTHWAFQVLQCLAWLKAEDWIVSLQTSFLGAQMWRNKFSCQVSEIVITNTERSEGSQRVPRSFPKFSNFRILGLFEQQMLFFVPLVLTSWILVPQLHLWHLCLTLSYLRKSRYRNRRIWHIIFCKSHGEHLCATSLSSAPISWLRYCKLQRFYIEICCMSMFRNPWSILQKMPCSRFSIPSLQHTAFCAHSCGQRQCSGSRSKQVPRNSTFHLETLREEQISSKSLHAH